MKKDPAVLNVFAAMVLISFLYINPLTMVKLWLQMIKHLMKYTS